MNGDVDKVLPSPPLSFSQVFRVHQAAAGLLQYRLEHPPALLSPSDATVFPPPPSIFLPSSPFSLLSLTVFLFLTVLTLPCGGSLSIKICAFFLVSSFTLHSLYPSSTFHTEFMGV